MTHTDESVRRLFGKAYGALARLIDRNGPGLRWVVHPDDLSALRMMARSYVDSSAVTERADSGDMTLLGVEVSTSEDVAPGSLSLVIEATP